MGAAGRKPEGRSAFGGSVNNDEKLSLKVLVYIHGAIVTFRLKRSKRLLTSGAPNDQENLRS